MAALALAVGAFLVQTRLPNAKCFIEFSERCGSSASLQEPSGLCPSSIQAMRRGSQTPRCVVLLESAAQSTYALELDSGKRTR